MQDPPKSNSVNIHCKFASSPEHWDCATADERSLAPQTSPSHDEASKNMHHTVAVHSSSLQKFPYTLNTHTTGHLCGKQTYQLQSPNAHKLTTAPSLT
jgi:hypothetical protein